ncbi:MAG TPA: LPS export ABC transporter periplasmic protein LptC [Macromonas sp.]|nr:LPS export ABC transporter periplasmic protein LptC [Macromonas sp.]
MVLLWDRVSLYLPVLAMGVLALLSYWILRTSPLAEAPRPEKPVTHQPDYFMRDFAVRTFTPDGTLDAEIFGKEARHYPDTQTLEVDQARLRSVRAAASPTHGTAQKLSINAANTRYLLQGQVKVTRVGNVSQQLPEMTFEGEELLIQMDEKTISSTRPVVLTRGNDRFTANTLHYDDQQSVATLQGQVHTTLAPRR